MSEEKAEQVRTLKAHLALNVRNVERSTEFYKKMLGLEPSKVRQGYAKFDVQNPPLNLTLNEATFESRGALSHLGIQVAETADVLAMREQWIERGLATREEMQTNCCYALQDKAWVQDPDGNEWEVFVVLQDNLLETSACCTTDAASVKETNAAISSSPANSKAEASTGCATTEAGLAQSSCCSTTSATVPIAVSR
jgi:catechol 2,3-dioxygenase-like lactoylglutathione lyase family enzyme